MCFFLNKPTVLIYLHILQVPANTMVLINSYRTAHNPDVYEDPFTVKADRFLDKEGKVVEPGHPLRQKYVTPCTIQVTSCYDMDDATNQ